MKKVWFPEAVVILTETSERVKETLDRGKERNACRRSLSLTRPTQCDTLILLEIHREEAVMPLSLRIPPDKERAIAKAASKTGKTKTAYILEAVDEKLGLRKSREEMIRGLAGFLSHAEAQKLRKAVKIFDKVNEGDWD